MDIFKYVTDVKMTSPEELRKEILENLCRGAGNPLIEEGRKMKIGRNDPCTCGSGKKYKQCCLKNQEQQQKEDVLWRQIRHVINALHEKLLKFSSKRFGNEALLEAWAAFIDSNDVEFSPETPHLHIFLSWFFYDWNPDQAVLKEKAAFEPLRDQTLAQLFLEKHRKQLEPLLVRYIEQCCSVHYSFYDIVSVRAGDGFLLRDMMTGEEEYVTEHAGSQKAQAGDVVFGKFIKIDHVAVLETSASISFSPVEKRRILDLREEICEQENPPSQALLRGYDYEMMEIYREIYERLSNPTMPKIRNADGDTVLFHRLKYDIDSPQQAFDALKQLNLDTNNDEMLVDAEFDSAGELHGVSFLWQQQTNAGCKSGSNAILGQIKIKGDQLTVEVDSETHAQQFRQLVEKLLPTARYKTTDIESMESRLA
ncbi:SEC-C metal-binding domain-containing protein [Nitrosomonas aestuarii]|nr:SEC-C metal-binding domain-containing protein [Nitrosomonas aestuarii]